MVTLRMIGGLRMRSIATTALLAGMFLFGGRAVASVTASISGTVKDSTGAVLVGATVTATNTETNIADTRRTNSQGYYSFQSLPLGQYSTKVEQDGFKAFVQTGLILNVNAALVVDVTLEVGRVSQKVEVLSSTLNVETMSTQLGEVISNKEMTDVPLVSRSYVDLLALQPGVTPTSSGMSGAGAGNSGYVAAGFAQPPVSGDLNAGNLSVNGMRESGNGFLLNGGIVQEFAFGGTAVIPNLDSIAEFRILTNNFDPEYGNYSGGQINVITKSGTNRLHGSAFEFLRNTDFDAANYFDQGKRGPYNQNQFGGTIGGPVKRDKLFFFGDYQGNRVVQGASSGQIGVPSISERGGDFSTVASQMTGTVVGTVWGNQLSQELGYAVTQGEPYYSSGCTTSSACVFPNAKIPASALSSPAQNLLKYIPSPNNGAFFSTSSQPIRLRDDKTSGRMDGNTQFGMLSAYYFFDDYTLNNPYPSATVPGFNALGTGRTQLLNLGDTKTFGSTTVNEFRFEAVRTNLFLNSPSGGAGVSLSSLGFTTGANTPGIYVQNPAIEGVPEIDFSAFVIGVPSIPNHLTQNTFQWMDNLSKVVGTHTLKLGGAYHYTQLVEQDSNVVNGSFQFSGTETGIDFADFLIGAPTSFNQGASEPSNGRTRYGALYAEDSWRARSNLSINYGLRWEFSTPFYEKNNQLETLVPGLQSKVFPGAPTGWVFPLDPGIPRTIAPTRYNNFAPRVGFNYSPSASDGFVRTLTGGPGKTSIRLGYGLFYTSFEGASDYNINGDAPFGLFYGSPVGPSFTTPFVDRSTGNSEGQRFPVKFPPLNVGPNNPDNSVDWSKFVPISGSPGFYYKNQLPYAEQYELSIQRELTNSTLMTVSYVGTQAHQLLSKMESNPGDPALCLSVSQPNQVAPGSPTCGPGGENGVYTTASGQVIHGTRTRFGPDIQSNAWFRTIGQSSYNSFQLNLRHRSGPLQLLAGYTYSKSMDNSSGYADQVNPFTPKSSIGLSAFDVTHNFVVSYTYVLPFARLGGRNRLTEGWQLSGITRFASGLPVNLIEGDDHSLWGTSGNGQAATPSLTPGPLSIGTDPRSGQPYFDISRFSPTALGQVGTSRRRFFHGPGINNWDLALLKNTKLTEGTELQFRAEFFNILNHAQFASVQGKIGTTNFGFAQTAAPPRIGQLALKLLF